MHRLTPLSPTFLVLGAVALFLSGGPGADPLAGQGIPQGWEVRPDAGGHAHGGAAPDGLVFETMAPGWHVTTGPAVILWRPETTASGTYRVEADLHLFDPGTRREAFGIFLGGRDLHGDDQAYTYLMLREGGQYLVKRREGEAVPTVVDWTDHPAIRGWADRGDGAASVLNSLAVEVRDATVHLFVNGSEVTSVPRSGLATDGVVGLRVNHGLNLHISRLEVTPSG